MCRTIWAAKNELELAVFKRDAQEVRARVITYTCTVDCDRWSHLDERDAREHKKADTRITVVGKTQGECIRGLIVALKGYGPSFDDCLEVDHA